MMLIVNTVLGPVSTGDLGFTLMHEHVVSTAAGLSQNYPEFLDSEFMAKAVERLTQIKKEGIDTIVDATTTDLGRDVTALAHLARLSGVNLITCTGWWLREPFFLAGASADQIAKIFVREIEVGIAGTNIKAGIIKGASENPGVTEWQAKVLRAIARAHRQTGLPIMLHSNSPGKVGTQQVAILKEEGVDLSRVKLDHSNDTTDLDYLKWLLEQGCYLGMDRYPGRGLGPLERNQTLKALIDAGYADRLLPSHDWSLLRPMGDSPMGPPKPPEPEGRAANPHGCLYVKNEVFPSLREMGVAEEILDRLCIVGPRNFFAGVK